MDNTFFKNHIDYDLDLEQAVLGIFLLEKDSFGASFGLVEKECFFNKENQLVFEHIESYWKSGGQIDLLTIARTFYDKGIEYIGHSNIGYFLAQLSSKVISSAHLRSWCLFLRELYAKRIMHLATSGGIKGEDIFQQAGNIQKLINKALEIRSNDDWLNGSKVAELLIESMNKAKDGDCGVTTSINMLDDINGGFKGGQMIVIGARPGTGKCFKKGTEILMHDGTIKNIEEIKVGEFVLGIDGEPRNVLNCHYGKDNMYEVTQLNGISYTVNSKHDLCLKAGKKFRKYVHGDEEVMEVNKFVSLSKSIQEKFKGYMNDCTYFSHKNTNIDPYILGVWLGDGNSADGRIHNPDKEIVDYCNFYAKSIGVSCITKYYENKHCYEISIVRKKTDTKTGKGLKFKLNENNLLKNKHIPRDFLFTDKESRLNLLAGLLDSDGYVSKNGMIEIIQKKERLINDIKFLCNSLGFRTSIKIKKSGIKSIGFTGYYYRMIISGNTSIIPLKVKRKKDSLNYSKFTESKMTQIKINAIGYGEYFGIEIDGDHKFMLKDFTVVHNSAYFGRIAVRAAAKGKKIGVISLEMVAKDVFARMVSAETDVPFYQIDRNQIVEESQRNVVYNGINSISKLPIYFSETAQVNIHDIRAKADKLNRRYGLDLLIIDYLQLIEGNGTKNKNRENEVSEISRGIKLIAMNMNIPVIALAQLNRNVEGRKGKDRYPQLSDLRESGCLSGETKIQIPALKRTVRIRDLVCRNSFNVFATNNKETKIMDAKKAFYTGVKDVFCLELINGQSIEATNNHRFLTSLGWKRLDQLLESDKIAIPINYGHIEDNLCINEVSIIGHMLSNGCALKGRSISYTHNILDDDLTDIVISDAILATNNSVKPYFKDTFIEKSKFRTIFFKPSFHLTHGKTSPIADIMRKYELWDVRTKEKKIPDALFYTSIENTIALLKSLFSGDGTVYYSEKNGRKSLKISYSSASKELIYGVQQLLSKIGIISFVAETSNEKKQTWFQLYISGKSNIKIFVENIGFHNNRKNDIMVKGWNEIKNKTWGWTKYKFNENRSLCFMPIKHILSIGEKEVFDIEVPVLHNFVANNIIVHNSLEQDADIVMFLHRDYISGVTEDENGNSTIENADLLVRKWRNGSTAEIKLHFKGETMKFSEESEINKENRVKIESELIQNPHKSFNKTISNNLNNEPTPF